MINFVIDELNFSEILDSERMSSYGVSDISSFFLALSEIEWTKNNL